LKGFEIKVNKIKKKTISLTYHRDYSWQGKPKRKVLGLSSKIETVKSKLGVYIRNSYKKDSHSLPPWTTANKFPAYCDELVILVMMAMISCDYVFQVSQRNKTQQLPSLIEFTRSVFEGIEKWADAWLTLENLLRVFQDDEALKRNKSLIDELYENKSSIIQQVTSKSRNTDPEAYRDNLRQSIENSFQRTNNVKYDGSRPKDNKFLLITRWYVMSQVYTSLYTKLLSLKSTDSTKTAMQKQRHDRLNYRNDTNNDQHGNWNGGDEENISGDIDNLEEEQGGRGAEETESDERSDSLPPCPTIDNNSLATFSHMEEDASETIAEGETQNTPQKSKEQCPQMKLASSTGQEQACLIVEDGNCSKYILLSPCDFYYFMDFHKFPHRVEHFKSKAQMVADCIDLDGTRTIFIAGTKAGSDFYHQFGIARKGHKHFDYIEKADVNYSELIAFMRSSRGIASSNKRTDENTYRLSLGAANHNYNQLDDYFNDIPRCNSGWRHLKDHPDIKKYIANLVDGMQDTMDAISTMELKSEPVCRDQYLDATFTKNLVEWLGCKKLRFPCIDVVLTRIDSGKFVAEHTDNLNAVQEGNNYTCIASFFFAELGQEMASWRLTIILYHRKAAEVFARKEIGVSGLKDKLQQYKKDLIDRYTELGLQQDLEKIDFQYSTWKPIPFGEGESSVEIKILKLPHHYSEEIRCSPGIHIMRSYFEETGSKQGTAEILLLLLYQTNFENIFIVGTEILKKGETQLWSHGFAVFLAAELNKIYGQCSMEFDENWVKYYAIEENRTKAVSGIMKFLEQLESTPNMDLLSFQSLVQKLSGDVYNLPESHLQFTGFYAALAGFVLVTRLENATIAYPVNDTKKQCTSINALHEFGFKDSDFQKVSDCCCRYFGLNEKRSLWGNAMLCNISQMTWNHEPSDIILQGQSLYRIRLVNDKYVVQQRGTNHVESKWSALTLISSQE
jgi:hypothetical protein